MNRSAHMVFLLAALLLPVSAMADPPDKEALFGLVIGSNTTHDGSEPPLRYADDDAVLNAQLLRQLGARIILLTAMDEQTRALHPDENLSSPTLAALEAATSALNEAMDNARREGKTPVLYIFYSGHGDVEHNEGYVHLADGKLWRKDLIRLLEESTAARNHVVIDACKSYFMVFARGAGGSRRPVEAPMDLSEGGLPDNTGVLLSTSSATESHEWEAYQSGIFSHEVRSALRGAADVNLDSAVSYTEAAAFVWTANSQIANRKFRPQLYARPPGGKAGRDAVLARTDTAGGDRLAMGPGLDSHTYVEDADGLRLADLHPAGDQRLVLLLPASRPIFVRDPVAQTEVELPAGERLEYSRLTSRQVSSSSRGAPHVAFEKLFESPFSPDAIADYESSPDDDFMTLEPADTDLTWLRRGIGILSILSLAAGGTMTGLAAGERGSIDGDSSGLDRDHANANIRDYNTAAISCYAIGGAAALSYLLWTFIPREEVRVQLASTGWTGLELEVEF